MSHLTQREQLDCYAFWWSQLRLLLAGVALLLGGVPAVFFILPGMYGIVWPLLKLCWIISGVVAVYLGYRWYEHKWHIFGGKDSWDSAAFALAVVTGLNLGAAGLVGTNIGMSIIGGRVVFFVVGVIYLVVAYRLDRRWRAHGKKVF